MRLWDVATGRELRRLEGHISKINAVAFSHDARFGISASDDNTILVWDLATGQTACQVISFRDGTWAVVDAEGRFDTNNPDGIKGLHWIMPDDPMHPLPMEIFMRDYFEPRLLARVFNGEKVKPIQYCI